MTTPEAQARQSIDQLLTAAGWAVQYFKHAAIRQANAALQPATLERVFAGNL